MTNYSESVTKALLSSTSTNSSSLLLSSSESKKKSRLSNFENFWSFFKKSSSSSSALPGKKITGDVDEELIVFGFDKHPLFSWIVIFLSICFFGVPFLFFYWRPDWKLKLTHRRISLGKATRVLVQENYKSYSVYYVKKVYEATNDFQVPTSGPEFMSSKKIRYFRCKKRTYLWNEESEHFLRLEGLENNIPVSYFHSQEGLSSTEQFTRSLIYGPNMIDVPQHSIFQLLLKEVLNPFYVFQVASVILWFADEYYCYAIAIVLMSLGGITSAVYQTHQNQINLKSTIHTTDIVSILRGDEILEEVYSEILVPGDVIVIPSHGCQLHCDVVLISGNAIVNEAMLTGEAVPVTKTSLPRSDSLYYSESEHNRHTLYCGTKVIQTRYYGNHRVLGVVVRTGFMTAKGNLVRSIMYPPPVDFKFEQDSYKFIGFLSLLASSGFLYTCIRLIKQGASFSDIALDALDLITMAVPPALPAAMTIGCLYAQKRLRKKNIYCISPRAINVSGSIDCICFDKTGTLTEDGMDLWAVVPVTSKATGVYFEDVTQDVIKLSPNQEIVHAMATCHSLTIIENELCGDPLDLKMFEATEWDLKEPTLDSCQQYDTLAPTIVRPPSSFHKDTSLSKLSLDPLSLDLEIGIVRQFPFSSSLQRMSVITRALGAETFSAFVKGSPEMIYSLSDSSTIPSDFHSVLESYAHKGYRVIALASRSLHFKYAKIQRIDRSELEKDLKFLGLIVMENRLKLESKPVIRQLMNANIRTIMVTGDNLLTAVCVARECELVSSETQRIHFVTANQYKIAYNKSEMDFKDGESSHSDVKINMNTDCSDVFAIDGKSFEMIREYHKYALDILVTKTAIFARMKPEQKQQLVEMLQSLGYYVAMCGDGANDCGALRAAHAGISLSDAESSVASPFTSKEPNISCVPELIREGRCALVTSFGIFKYMAAYSMTQFLSVLILYSIDTNLSDVQFLYIDLFIITVFAFFFGMTEAFPGELAKVAPMKSLISLTPLCSLILQLIPIFVFQLLTFYHVQTQEWFVPFNDSNTNYAGTVVETYYNSTMITDSQACWENYAVFTISAFQYIILAFIFSKSAPYRKTVVSNYGFVSALVLITAFTLYLSIEPTQWLQVNFELLLPPNTTYKLILLLFAVINMLISVLMENFVVEFLIFKKLRYFFHSTSKSKRRYLMVSKSFKKDIEKWSQAISVQDASFKMTSFDSPIHNLQINSQIVNEKEAFNNFSTLTRDKSNKEEIEVEGIIKEKINSFESTSDL